MVATDEVEFRIARFRENVDVLGENECWPWLAGGNRRGYGSAVWIGNETFKAHQVAWMVANGRTTIPDKARIGHSCRNKGCCNPSHLVFSAGFYLSPQEVEEIKKAICDGVSGVEIARKHGVSTSMVSRIKRGSRWSHAR